jgi:hypothetical protein
MKSSLRRWLLLGAVCVSFAQLAYGAATIVIQNGDPAGVGFNDPTPVAPVGGNAGTTLGQQRLNVFQAAATKWGATLTSAVTIPVLSTWEALSCTASGAVLGSAGATEVFFNFTGAPFSNTLYSFALANKISGVNLDPGNAQIRARFNINLGQAGCLTGSFFYLGLDGNHGTNVDLLAVLLHELGHGLGFQTFTDGQTGAFLVAGMPSIWDRFLFDTSSSLLWSNMSNAQRAASAIGGKLVWNGANAVAAVPTVLAAGVPILTVTAPASVAGTYDAGAATFGPALTSPGVTGEVMPVFDTDPDTGLACFISPADAASIAGKIALVDRGSCAFTQKVANAQAAGAIAVIVVDNVPGSPPPALGGTDPTITIPSIRITMSDGQNLKNFLHFRSRSHSGLMAKVGVNSALRQYADASNRPFMFAPNPYQPGSSVSHWDTRMFPNQLMEPVLNTDQPHEVAPPTDLTFPLLKDTGW